MKHIFILNPVSGRGTVIKDLMPKIIQAANELGIPYETHISRKIGDCEEFVKNYHEPSELLRFYSCGGDGTLNEVINGAFGKENVEVAVIPSGTGNDFVKTFKDFERFSNVRDQFIGTPIKIDLISYNNKIGVNVCNIGFDSAVADRIINLKTKPFISGSVAYGVGIFQEFFNKMGNLLDIKIDDEEIISGEMLLVAVGVGAYYGGGFKALPYASRFENTLDVCLVRKIGRIKFLSVINSYKKGFHVNDARLKDIVIYRKCKSLTIKCDQEMKLCVDGEVTLEKEIEFKIIPKGISLSLPFGVIV